MVDHTRPHHRIALDSVPDAGLPIRLAEGIQGKLYLPEKWQRQREVRLLIHFHGDSRVGQYAVDRQEAPWILFHCHWGGGSSSYDRPIAQMGPEVFLEAMLNAIAAKYPESSVTGIYLSGWSAGYGAIRRLIGQETAATQIDGILLMDGLHCSYVPERKVLAEGGELDEMQMEPFVNWAQKAVAGEKSFIFTHSSVFPGTYASTTETADYILRKLGINRRSLLAPGPVGMQQTSVASDGNLYFISFAGNSAPDHIDHYHGMGMFLRMFP